MIISFGDQITEDLFHGNRNAKLNKIPKELQKVIIRKLDLLNNASNIQDLVVPPGNKLEKLKGDLKKFYSIRVNDQFRIIFIWEDAKVYEVRFVDYH